MIDFERHIGFTAIGASPVELFQQVLSDLVTDQGALLIFNATDFSILHQLGVETNPFNGSGNDRNQG